MKLKLAIVIEPTASGCWVEWLAGGAPVLAHYGARVQGRIRIVAGQLVAVDCAGAPTLVWRWFRGTVVYRRGTYAVVDNHVYQPSLRAPISALPIADVVEQPVELGAEVFYGLGEGGAIIDLAINGRPACPERIAADLFPVIAEIYAEWDGAKGGADAKA